MSVCLYGCQSVCPLAFRKNHTSEFYQIFSTHVTCGRGLVLRNKLRTSGLQMTASFHIMEEISQNERRRVRFVQFARWRHYMGAKSTVFHCILLPLSTRQSIWRRQTSLLCCHLANWTKRTRRLWFWPISSLHTALLDVLNVEMPKKIYRPTLAIAF